MSMSMRLSLQNHQLIFHCTEYLISNKNLQDLDVLVVVVGDEALGCYKNVRYAIYISYNRIGRYFSYEKLFNHG